MARKAVPEEDFSVVGEFEKWNVFSKPVLRYLGRYPHRIAIALPSILKITDHQITFRYKKSTDQTLNVF